MLNLRKQEAGAEKGERYREFTGYQGYRPNERVDEFLARHGVASDQPADPDEGVPYYLLIVGSPEVIPYRFQYELDVQYAVGRLHFDTLEEYRRYANSVVAAESGTVVKPRQAVFFGVRNNGPYEATQLGADYLVKPLVERMQRAHGDTWKVESPPYQETTKVNLIRLLGGTATPALLFTASHGMGFEKSDPRLRSDQGELVCQDWPGIEGWKKPIPDKFYFAAADVPPDASLMGLIAFHFACYGAGTPALDDYPYAKVLRQEGAMAALAVNRKEAIAQAPFVARLPQRLLGHERGGALAVISHVERAWGCSFYLWQQARAQTQTFGSVLELLMRGNPVGQATEFLNQRYAAVSVPLNKDLEDIRYGRQIDVAFARRLVNEWTAYNDAGAYVVVGDPAVRLPLDGPGKPVAVTPNAMNLTASN